MDIRLLLKTLLHPVAKQQQWRAHLSPAQPLFTTLLRHEDDGSVVKEDLVALQQRETEAVSRRDRTVICDTYNSA